QEALRVATEHAAEDATTEDSADEVAAQDVADGEPAEGALPAEDPAEETIAAEHAAEEAAVAAEEIATEREGDALDRGAGVAAAEKPGVGGGDHGRKAEGEGSRDDERAARRFEHDRTPSGGLRDRGAQQI